VGLPGDTLEIKDAHVWLNGKQIEDPKNMQLNYFVQTTGPIISNEMFDELGISEEDRWEMGSDMSWENELLSMGLNTRQQNGRLTPTYNLPLTKEMLQKLHGNKKLVSKIVMEPERENYVGQLFPLNLHTHWTRNDYGPIWIPKKGATVKLTEDNLPVYERCIEAYEGNKLERKSDGLYINGVKTDEYTFQMDYYWMMGDNRHKSADSRYWGFVPEDHVVGKPVLIWLSLDKDKGWFDGKIRWSRLFKWVDDIK
jgi:signal peptidase I